MVSLPSAGLGENAASSEGVTNPPLFQGFVRAPEEKHGLGVTLMSLNPISGESSSQTTEH